MKLADYEIDEHVGRRVKLRREALVISQTRLGQYLGLSFTQIQKYEKAANRISAGRLFKIATLLTVPVSYFFEGLDIEGETVDQPLSPRGQRVGVIFDRLEDEDLQQAVLELLSRIDPAAEHRRKK